jgi:membrane fusion protein (multidrug efflux system)
MVEPVRLEAPTIGVPLVASVEAVKTSVIASQEAGLVATRSFDVGDEVKAGQTLITLDIDVLLRELDAARTTIAAAEAEVVRSQVAIDNARREFERQESMRRTGVTTEKEYLDAVAALASAEATINVSRANVARAKAEVVRLETIIAKALVQAPFPGSVARRMVEVGQWVERGGAVAEIVQMDPLFVRVSIPESIVSRIGSEVVAQVMFDALPGRTFEASLHRTFPVVDPNSRAMTARFMLANPTGEVRPGFFARVVLRTGSQPALAVPKDSIVRRGTVAHVVVFRNGVAAIEPVTVLAGDGPTVYVSSGSLKEGELVVTRGNESLQPGMPLAPMNLGGPPGGPPGPPAGVEGN